MAQKTKVAAQPTAWVGWLYFAAVLLLGLGGMQIIGGLTAILRNSFYLTTSEGLMLFNFTTWGWIHLTLGVVAMLTGIGLLAGNAVARTVAVFLAVLALISNAIFLTAFPIWSIIAIVVSGLVIYALTMHGNEINTY